MISSNHSVTISYSHNYKNIKNTRRYEEYTNIANYSYNKVTKDTIALRQVPRALQLQASRNKRRDSRKGPWGLFRGVLQGLLRYMGAKEGIERF